MAPSCTDHHSALPCQPSRVLPSKSVFVTLAPASGGLSGMAAISAAVKGTVGGRGAAGAGVAAGWLKAKPAAKLKPMDSDQKNGLVLIITSV
jgi:hypothetical protein